jgi:transposase-like protein
MKLVTRRVQVTDSLRPRFAKLALLLQSAEEQVFAFMDRPASLRTKLHSTNPLEGLNKEIKRRTDVVGIFANEGSVVGLVGALLLEQYDERAIARRHMLLEALAEVLAVGSEVERPALPRRTA